MLLSKSYTKLVVATNTGGVPDIIVDGETGMLIPVKNPDAIAKAVIELLANRRKAKFMGKREEIA